MDTRKQRGLEKVRSSLILLFFVGILLFINFTVHRNSFTPAATSPLRGFHQLTHTQGQKLINFEVFRGRLGFALVLLLSWAHPLTEEHVWSYARR